ncbi:hypothetical protein PLICRDRAFT_508189 [Plicaturopsis crispa FD-325 SS-3]|nr:hypothetical protein PLICRDRAFT_508189 [Plicaturopsis crispa FD-325 SS-3]
MLGGHHLTREDTGDMNNGPHAEAGNPQATVLSKKRKRLTSGSWGEGPTFSSTIVVPQPSISSISDFTWQATTTVDTLSPGHSMEVVVIYESLASTLIGTFHSHPPSWGEQYTSVAQQIEDCVSQGVSATMVAAIAKSHKQRRRSAAGRDADHYHTGNLVGV